MGDRETRLMFKTKKKLNNEKKGGKEGERKIKLNEKRENQIQNC